MVRDQDAELMANLPMQTAPPPGQDGVPRLRTAERRQVELRAVCLDELVPADHRVGVVWQFAEGLGLAPLYDAIRAVGARAGHPPADPRMLLALWLYATVAGIGSARELARRCQEQIGFQWLCGGVGMNAKTLADFRVGHGPVLERPLLDSFAALLKVGAAKLDRVAQDGVRVHAAAGAAWFRRYGTLEACRREAEDQVGRLRAELDQDPGRAGRRQAASRQRAAEDRARRVRGAPTVTAALAHAGVIACVPVPAPRDTTREQYARQPGDPPAIAGWCERMGGEPAKAIYRQRAATAECAIAQARNRGLRQFVVRGLDKVRNIALWHALTHNMVCTWRLLPA